MDRRHLLRISSAAGLAACVPLTGQADAPAPSRTMETDGSTPGPFTPPAHGDIPVAFLISDGAVVIDFAGPWEVFSDVAVPGRRRPFSLYTVAETDAPLRASGGMAVVPNFTFVSAPRPKVLVIPAQGDPSPAVIAWVRDVARTADLTMSVCTGAFLLAATGLLAGKPATTHHGSYAELAMRFPDVLVRRGARYVDAGNIATSGGLSSGIDLALHVVERYFGHAIAANTADSMEYQGTGWTNPDTNQAYAHRRVSTAQHPLCAVCDMDIDRATAPTATYRQRTYYFCGAPHKALFETKPENFTSG